MCNFYYLHFLSRVHAVKFLMFVVSLRNIVTANVQTLPLPTTTTFIKIQMSKEKGKTYERKSIK